MSSGDASLVVTSTMAVGTHDLVAEYAGSGIFRSSQGDLVETITPDTAVDASGVGVTPSKFTPSSTAIETSSVPAALAMSRSRW